MRKRRYSRWASTDPMPDFNDIRDMSASPPHHSSRQRPNGLLAGADDGDDDEDVKFPTLEEMQMLPDRIRDALMELVFDSLRKTMLPRLRFLVSRNRVRIEADLARRTSPLVPSSFLLTLSLFHKWTNIDEVPRSMEIVVLKPRQVLCFQGDESSDSVYFLVSGILHCRVKRGGTSSCALLFGEKHKVVKGFPDAITTLTKTLECVPPPQQGKDHSNPPPPLSVKVINEKVLFTEQPAPETVKAANRCVLWKLSKDKYFELLALQTADKQEHIKAVCYATRKDLISVVAPISLETLHQLPVFAVVPLPLAQLLHQRLEPRVYPSGAFLCNKGDMCSEVLIIARGHVQVCFKDESVKRFGRGTLWGEVAALFVKKSVISVVAEGTVDCLVLPRDVIVNTVSNTAIMADILKVAHMIESSWEAAAKTRFLPLVQRIPLLAEACPTPNDLASVHTDILEELTSCVYPSNSTIASASDGCDRLIIPVRGKSRITATNEELTMGECIGFTCVVPHRWKYHVGAFEAVQTLELTRTRFRDILQKHRILSTVESLVQGLLFPNVSRDMFLTAVRALKNMSNPPLFLPSDQSVVSSLEPRFAERRIAAQHSFAWAPKAHITAEVNVRVPLPGRAALDSTLADDDARVSPSLSPQSLHIASPADRSILIETRRRRDDPLQGSPAMRHLYALLQKGRDAEGWGEQQQLSAPPIEWPPHAADDEVDIHHWHGPTADAPCRDEGVAKLVPRVDVAVQTVSSYVQVLKQKYMELTL